MGIGPIADFFAPFWTRPASGHSGKFGSVKMFGKIIRLCNLASQAPRESGVGEVSYLGSRDVWGGAVGQKKTN